jgi:hypothetical protein
VGTHRYQVTVSGSLGEIGREAFGDFRIEADGTSTTLVGDLDQAALYGVLNSILSPGFELLEVTRLTVGPASTTMASKACPAAGPSEPMTLTS